MVEKPNASNRAYDGERITPSDTVLNQWDALYIGVAGDVTIKFPGKTTTLTFPNVAVGWFPCCCDYVMSTGTTALQINGLKVFDTPIA